MSRTASPATVPLPRTPEPELPDSFDALIDLLAGGGGLDRLATAPTGLRDDDGNLDVGKIRAALEPEPEPSPSLQWSFGAPGFEFESTVQGTPRLRPEQSHADAPSSLLPFDPDLTPARSADSVSPLALPSGLVREEPVPFDSLLDTPIPTSFPFYPPVQRPNPELKRMNDDLAKAKEEVRDLKSRMKIMKSLLVRNNDAQHQVQPANLLPPAQAQRPDPEPPSWPQHPHQRDEIDALDGESARMALRNVFAAASLPVSAASALSSASYPRAAAADGTGAGPASVEELRGALQFVRDVDELVWRRRRFPGAVAPLDVFHETNIIDLRDRVELWERAVRAPPSS
ncbi:hypothetical protein EXIGLDRAFT_772234 [Exidia glandulosa HHB12029]|uniref:Uncharacterized protein n=1 Tax=Exidia glandulosa HHB12029 TaxID=1314781 RepID=A0A165FG30_EXIGL|nr:hypothetical protein EXIGLDRAFT_772234 [Exidia glandulosa HHB12029]